MPVRRSTESRPSLLFISFFFFVWQPTSENKIFDVVLLSVFPAPTPPSLFSHSAVSQSCTYTNVHPHTLYFSKHAHTATHSHRGENQANRPHEFLLKWDYWNGSRCFSMSIIAHYASGDKSIYFPSGLRSNYSCSLLHTRWWNSGSWTNLVNNMSGCLSGFNMRCQLRLAGVWQVSQTDKIPSAPDRICISQKLTHLAPPINM